MLKSIPKTLILAMCASAPVLANGATRSPEEAKDVAAEFFKAEHISRLADKDTLSLVHVVNNGALKPVSYVFNANDGKGFIIVSAETEAIPVIGYSDTNIWDLDAIPTVTQTLLSEPVFDSYVPVRRATRAEAQEKVLKTPEWSQEAPFNNNIPNRRLTGCVGVALAEIMKYHNTPANRPASLVNSGEATTYAWDQMRMDNYRSGYGEDESNAVATLVADAAIGIGTEFNLSSSSAFEVKVPYALTSLFGYDVGVSYKKLSEIQQNEWVDILVNEVDADRPVLFSGQDVSAGHAFVCDGYKVKGNGSTMLHFNWGWGGSANGYFTPGALNPVVSKSHSYNDLQTIVYNIKPASNNLTWSPIHITNDENQPGLTIDVTDISSANSFTLRAGTLKNISNSDFSGQLAVALFGSDGKMKALLSDARNFSLIALQMTKYVDFTGKLPDGTSVAADDVVRLVTKAANESDWCPVAGDLLVMSEARATNGTLSYFTINLPSTSDDYEVTTVDNQVIKGRDYSFKVVGKNAEKVITVKSNGFILSPDANNNYQITNVLADQKIDIVVQNTADVVSKRVLWLTAGNLQNLLDENETSTVKDLTLFGTMNANDFAFIRERMKVNRLDLSNVNITASGSNPANAIPTKAFKDYRSLQTVILPKNLTTFKNACFNNTGLTSVEIPASVTTFEYNVFLSCGALREVIYRRSNPGWVNWCVFTGTPQTRLVVPVGATDTYKSKEYWQDFKEIVEENPIEPDHFYLTVAEKKGLKFTSITEGTEFAKGDNYEFQLDTDNSFEDAVMQVYANSTRLNADANGIYRTTVNGNTLIHVEFVQPQATTVDQTWKITGDAGGIGLVTDVVNVPVGKNFTVRANAIKVPKGDDAAKFYGMVLTDKNGAIKEFISSIVSNYYSRTGENLAYNFYCQVKDAQVKEGNQIRLATSYNKKDWQLVTAEADTIIDCLEAINNPVIYHNVTMPESVTGARIEGSATQVVRGMPFNIKASAINPAQRVNVAVNGETKVTNVAVANISIPAVLEDLDITVTVKDADAGDYMVYNIQEGQLASKLAECPERVKLIGSMFVSDFDALRANAATIIDLDMADVTIKGAAMTGNSIPENAFTPTSSSTLSALRTIILPNNLERISKNAFARCTQITEITIPANVNYIGDGAFSTCVALKKIIAMPKVAPTCGNVSPFPSNLSTMTLEVPKGSEESYSVPSTWWAMLPLYKAPAEAKDYYWVKVDKSRVGVVDYKGDLNSVAVGAADMEFILELPNCQQSRLKKEFRTFLRPGVAFKLYDNGVDVFANQGSYQYEASGYRVFPAQHWSMTAGRLGIRYLHSTTSGPWMPQNHEIDLWFYYSINFENKAGAQGVEAQVVEVPEGGYWENVPMEYFNINTSEKKPVLYREGSEIKFQLSNVPPKTELVVNLMSKVMTKTGPEPEYEEREMTLESANDIYTIPALEGDTWIRISGIASYDEGDAIPAEALNSLKKEDTDMFTELVVTGEMNESDFEVIRENFGAVENLDLSQIKSDVIPANAFAGMENLRTVVMPSTVTEIGEGAFQGCENVETITLPGVNTIGEGAFEGCTNLTSLLLPAADNSDSATRAGEANGITADSFKGLNPNCLIYLGSIGIPNSDHLNIILTEDGTRVAASDIELDSEYPFNAPTGFNLGTHTISYTAHIPASLGADIDEGWRGIMLPFTPTEWKYGVEFKERPGSGLQIVSLEPDAETMTTVTDLVVNKPYLAHVVAPFESVPVTFIGRSLVTRSEDEANGDETNGEEANGNDNEPAVKYDIPVSPNPEDIKIEGKNYTLYGSLDGETVLGECLALNELGSKFEASDSIKIGAFSAYISLNPGVTAKEVPVGEHAVWVQEPFGVTTQLYRGDKIELNCDTKNAVIYYTTDGSDPADAEGIRQIYSAPLDLEGESVVITAIAEHKGNVSEVVTLDFQLKKVDINYDLAQNWTWISHNMEDNVAVADFAANNSVSRILSQTQEAVRDPKLGLVGNLKELAPTVAYKVCVADAAGAKANVVGYAFNPTATVKLNAGWNWIGCPVDDASLLISDLLANVEVEEGDMIVGLEGIEEVDAEGNWLGTLNKLTAGNGYMYYSNSEKEFTYNMVTADEADANTKAAPTRASDETPWEVDIHKYPSVMPITAIAVDADGFDADLADYKIAAFCGNECRGIGMIVKDVLIINVHGNAGDNIVFHFIGADNRELITASGLTFKEMPVGKFSDPYTITLDALSSVGSIIVDGYEIIAENGSIVVKGELAANASAEVYDLAGNRLAASSAANGTVAIDGLEPGVRLIVVRNGADVLQSKIMVK